MNNTYKIIIFITLCFFILVLGIFSLSKLKVDDFHKAAVILLVDSSASNQSKLKEEKLIIRQLCSMLDPDDHLKMLRVSEDAYLIYEGSPQSSADVRKAMEKFTSYDAKEYGTAYGLALEKAITHATNMNKEGYVPSIVVIGDLENEGDTAKQLNWDNVIPMIKQLTLLNPNFSMMFLYANPEKLDKVKENLSPILGETHLIIGNEITTSKSLRRFLTAIGR